jgi:malate dehydrogenase
MKISIIGAGAVGASCAEYIAIKNFVREVVLLDIKEGVAEGKAMDLMQCAYLNSFNTQIKGVTNDYAATSNSEVVIITSGIPRKPGMTREELINFNAGIVSEVSKNIIKHSPNAIIIVVSNPMDSMTYLVHKTTKLPKNRIIGMGGILDSARFRFRLTEALDCAALDIEAMVIGGHSDKGLVPVLSKALYKGTSVESLLTKEKASEIVEATKVGGATLTKLLGTSAWYAPGAAVSELTKAIVLDAKKMFPCSAMLENEYQLSDICIGVPCVIGKDGIQQIIELELNQYEYEKLKESAEIVRKTNNFLN